MRLVFGAAPGCGIVFGSQGLPDWVIASSGGIWFHPSFGGLLAASPSVHEWRKRESRRKCDEASVVILSERTDGNPNG